MWYVPEITGRIKIRVWYLLDVSDAMARIPYFPSCLGIALCRFLRRNVQRLLAMILIGVYTMEAMAITSQLQPAA